MKYKNYYDKTHRQVEFTIGSQVMLYTPRTIKGFSTKFLKRWTGPYKIINKITDLNYRIESLSTKKNESVHVQRLRKYKPWNNASKTAT